nr:immunoglobulin heavy chain junction region [Macaca mulatta]
CARFRHEYKKVFDFW